MAVYAFSHIAVTADIRDQRQDCRRSTAYSLICRLSVGICWLLVDASQNSAEVDEVNGSANHPRNTLTPMQTLGPIQIRRCANSLQVAGPLHASEQSDQPVLQTMKLS